MIISMENRLKQIAIIGPTASGKTALAIQIAKAINGSILSLDSLSIYKEINIASAKPTIQEMDGVPHYGIDIIAPNEPFDVTIYAKLYQDISLKCKNNNTPLIIVGGSSFYLKMLIDGISNTPKPTHKQTHIALDMIKDVQATYNMLYEKDPDYMSKISNNDKYRIEKALLIYLASNMTPTQYFSINKPIRIIKDHLDIYAISTNRDSLRERIKQRTIQMVQNGLIDEVKYLRDKYGTLPNCMKAIGIKETLEYLERQYTKDELINLISIHTGQLAKRQETFNRTQFQSSNSLLAEYIYKEAINVLKS